MLHGMAVHPCPVLGRNVKHHPCWLSISTPSHRSSPLGCPSDHIVVTLVRAAFLLLAVYVTPTGLCYFRTYSSLDERKATAEFLSTPHQCIPDGLGELFVLGGPPMGHNPFQPAHSAQPLYAFLYHQPRLLRHLHV